MNETKISTVRRGQYVFAILGELRKHPDGLERELLFSNVGKELNLTEFERSADKRDNSKTKFWGAAGFATIAAVRAGWLIKANKGNSRWRISEEGRKAHERFDSAEKLYAEGKRQYVAWKEASKTEAETDYSKSAYGDWLLGRLCENEEERTDVMQLVSDSMIAANARGPRCWCVTSSPTRIRLNVCFMAVMTIRKSTVSLAVSEELLNEEQKKLLITHGEQKPGILKSYPTVHWYNFARSSFLEHLKLMWPVVEVMIQFAGTPKYGSTVWVKSHRLGIGAFIGEALGIELPAPVATAVMTDEQKDRSKPAYGDWLFEHLCEDEEERASLMRLIADSMIAANARGPRCWCVTSTTTRIRLNVGFMAVMTIRASEMSLAVSEKLLTPEQKEFLNNYGKKEPDALKTYPTVRGYRFSRSSFFAHLKLMWPVVEAMIQFAGTPINGNTIWRRSHRLGIGAYIEEMLGIELPEPAMTAEVDTVAVTTPPVLFSKVDYDAQGLLSQLEMGDIGLPEIQRPFVWSSTAVRDLFDSMYRGYPVGYLLFWSNSQLLQNAKAIGTTGKQHKTPARLVVDGQQRLTSLFAVMRGVEVLDKSFKKYRIRIAFRPRDGRFEVSNTATDQDPEFITDISEVWTSGKAPFGYVRGFLETLRERKPVSDDEEEIFFKNFDRLFDLTKFPFTALEISADVEEDAVAEIFVRINSKGVKLNQADFILTLLSVFWTKGRLELEDFCKRAIQPTSDEGQASPYNHLIAPAPDQLLRVAIAIGFFRARLKNAYQILRGKDVSTGSFSEEFRDAQFEILSGSQSVVLDLKHWHLFLNAIRAAGFRSKELIAGEAALMYTYAYYLIGTTTYKVPQQTLERLIGRWFYFVSVTARYSGSTESVMDEDLARVKDLSGSDAFIDSLEGVMASTLTDDFWYETAPFNLTSSSARNPSIFAFYAAQCRLAAPVLFSDKPVADYFDPTIVAVKKPIEKHHLFPKNWLHAQGVANKKLTDQVANFSYVEWSENIQISDESPAEYVPRLKEHFDSARWEKMSNLHALPEGWEQMDYETFLEARRTLIAGVIRRGYDSLGDDDSAATGVRFIADGSKEEQAVWVLIERLEKRLRKLVVVGYTQRWGAKAESMMREYLGESATRVIDENRKKAVKAYRLAGETDSMNEFLDFSYLGQLGQLMMTNEGWTLFREPFKEKRLLQEEMTKITRVRNDAAHFRSVPKLELMRCQIAVADLEKSLDSLSWAPKDEHGK